MRRHLERRLRALEAARRGGCEFWIYRGDEVRSPDGEQVTREEAESRSRAAGRFAFFISETDWRL